MLNDELLEFKIEEYYEKNILIESITIEKTNKISLMIEKLRDIIKRIVTKSKEIYKKIKMKIASKSMKLGSDFKLMGVKYDLDKFINMVEKDFKHEMEVLKKVSETGESGYRMSKVGSGVLEKYSTEIGVKKDHVDLTNIYITKSASGYEFKFLLHEKATSFLLDIDKKLVLLKSFNDKVISKKRSDPTYVSKSINVIDQIYRVRSILSAATQITNRVIAQENSFCSMFMAEGAVRGGKKNYMDKNPYDKEEDKPDIDKSKVVHTVESVLSILDEL